MMGLFIIKDSYDGSLIIKDSYDGVSYERVIYHKGQE